MPPSILLIDDSPGECELFRRAMTQAGFKGQLTVRHDRLGARDHLNEHSPNSELALILLDLHLRGERGLDALKELKQHRLYALLPIVMLTNSDDRRDIVACYQAGANGYVVKPHRFDELVTLSLHLWKFWIEHNCTCGLTTAC